MQTRQESTIATRPSSGPTLRLRSVSLRSPLRPLVLVLLGVLFGCWIVGASAQTHAEPGAAPPPARIPDSSGPVVLELFTSQGCSSCPPADRLLSELGSADDVIALSFHVDYWNYIGWTDPFSSAEFSERQRQYARQLAAGRVYTPQLVVDGRGECVGSDRREASQLLAAARRAPRHGRARLSVRPSAEERALHVHAVGAVTESAAVPGAVSGGSDLGRGEQLHKVPREAPRSRALELWLAVYETDLETPVESGENARRSLHNDYVVRHLEALGQATPGRPVDLRRKIALEASWKRENVGVVVFLRDPRTLAIHGAARWSPAG